MKFGFIQKIAKCFLIVVCTLFYNVYGFGVSENDVNAFITRSEFETLKNNYYEEINRLISNADKSIDYAIAAYLAGIRVEEEVDLHSNLSETGKYGGILEYWSSATDKSFDMKNTKYCYEDFTMGAIIHTSTMKVRYVNPELISATDEQKCATGNERDYTSSKRAKFKLNDGTLVNGLERGVYKTSMVWSYNEMKSYDTGDITNNTYVWNPRSPEYAINNAGSSLVQGTANYTMKAFGNYRTFPEISSTNVSPVHTCDGYFMYTAIGAITINTETVRELDYNINYPISSTNDYYWNTDDKTSGLGKVGSSIYVDDTKVSNYYACRTISRGNALGGGESQLLWNTINPSMYLLHTVPWMTNSVSANQEYLFHWNAVNNRNRQVKNGLIIATTKKIGVTKIKCQATVPGKLYLMASNTPIDNWTQSSFAGKVFNIDTANSSVQFEYGKLYNDIDIWCIFLPNSTSDLGILKIERIYQVAKSEDNV